MKPIVTLTPNPTIDGASETDRVRPVHKIRTTNERHYPGGGGVNVARVLAELGAETVPVYLAGGATGALLDELLAARGFVPRRVAIEGGTRFAHAVFERSTGQEYRFVPEGPEVTPRDWERAVAAVAALDFDWLVASGSLPRGLPADAYGALARLAAERGARFVLDTSGPALMGALAAGPVHLIKPSFGEFRALTGAASDADADVAPAAERLRAERGVEMVAVTLGPDGAALAWPGGFLRRRPPELPALASATGAGDSFLAGMVFALAQGRAAEDAFAFGMAAGAAAVLTPGTELCRREDVLRIYEEFG
jgi:6-phosphofructokinase 2